MKTKALFFTLALALVGFSLAVAADPKEAEMMKLGMPGEEHKKLSELTGKWNYTMKWWMSSDAKMEESKGKSTSKMILGGRFLQEEVKAKMGEMKFEGIGITGYDNIRKEYQTLWMDNMSTSLMTSAGSMDNDMLKISGEMSCPMTGEKQRKFRSELKFIDKDTHSYAMYLKDTKGKEYKSMEIEYKRAK